MPAQRTSVVLARMEASLLFLLQKSPLRWKGFSINEVKVGRWGENDAGILKVVER